jgi:GDP-4-dehydro-6-deoxy-D-mannose reductase
MKKYLITGFSGFVSQYFLDYLESIAQLSVILGVSRSEPTFDYASYKYVKCSFKKADLLEKSHVDDIIYQFQPDYILHLASYSSVGFSWQNPVDSFANNTNIFLNLIEQVRKLGVKCRILSIGSSEQYGNIGHYPLSEEFVCKPVSPYAVARVSQEMLSKVYSDSLGMDVIMTRSFNHIGARQKEIFVVSSFVKQLVKIKKYNLTPQITTGNLAVIRDFTDVRDIVRAYHLLFEQGKKGELYNICSSKGLTLNQLLDKICDILDIKVEIMQNPTLFRPNDNMVVIGSYQKIYAHVGWQPEITLEQTLQDMIGYWSDNI